MSKLRNKIALRLTALLILSSFGACSNKSEKAVEPEGEVGRYVPFNSPNTSFRVLDTKTGRMYHYWEGKLTYVDIKDAIKK
jgi:hypothetical protein